LWVVAGLGRAQEESVRSSSGGVWLGNVQFCADRARLCGVVEFEQAFFMQEGA
jgi:hypothetical protein